MISTYTGKKSTSNLSGSTARYPNLKIDYWAKFYSLIVAWRSLLVGQCSTTISETWAFSIFNTFSSNPGEMSPLLTLCYQ